MVECNADSIEILWVFRSCSEVVNIVWIQFSDYFSHFYFSQNELSHFFRPKWIDAGCLVYANLSTDVNQFILEPYRCLGHGLKMCILYSASMKSYQH